jgi:hypothetical protein
VIAGSLDDHRNAPDRAIVVVVGVRGATTIGAGLLILKTKKAKAIEHPTIAFA